jgi:O-antigen ligase
MIAQSVQSQAGFGLGDGRGTSTLFTRYLQEWGLFVLIFLTYTNTTDVLIKFHGVPSFTKMLAPLLGLIMLYRWLADGERPIDARSVAFGFVAFGLVSAISLFHAVYVERTAEALELLAKDALIATITVMLLRDGGSLRGLVWSILAGVIFLGSIAVFKYATGDLDNIYGGFAQTSFSHIAGELDSHRLSGTMADPNFYAALIAFALPLAFERMMNERRWLLRLAAAAALGLGLASIGLTASRGALVALGLVAGLAVLLLRPKLLLVLPLTLPIVIVGLSLVPVEYVQRYQAMLDLIPGMGGRGGGTETSIRGRLGEWAAAWAMFLDYPILGIGLAQYEPNFETYTLRLGTELRGGVRQAHSLYLEIAAERGLVGLAAFLALLGLAAWNVWKARCHAIAMNNHELGSLVTGIGMATCTLLTAMIFLHDAYPRMLWLAIALCLVMSALVLRDREFSLRRKVGAAAAAQAGSFPHDPRNR